ncbi:hypothetical protein BD413DRAFT_496185 [Trametes elegans]|nr:hypothetical protein BD413DRAFT_496185 [Trametes elegans]
MGTQAPQLPRPAAPATPVVAYCTAVRVRKVSRKARTKPAPPSAAYVPNPVQMFNRIVIHPVAWPAEALQWMGVPRTLPPTPAPAQTPVLPEMPAMLRETYACIADDVRRGRKVPREPLARLVVQAFAAMADAQSVYVYSRAKAYLTLGDLRVLIDTKHGFSGSGIAPVLFYLDEPYRRSQRARLLYWRSSSGSLEKGEEIQDDDHIAVTDVALLLAMAQEHRRWGVPPDANGNHTTRVMYPKEDGSGMIVLTAVTPAETLLGIK